jgi:hypothetical protein
MHSKEVANVCRGPRRRVSPRLESCAYALKSLFFDGRAVLRRVGPFGRPCPRSPTASQAREPNSPSAISGVPPSSALLHPCSKYEWKPPRRGTCFSHPLAKPSWCESTEPLRGVPSYPTSAYNHGLTDIQSLVLRANCSATSRIVCASNQSTHRVSGARGLPSSKLQQGRPRN